MQLQSAGSIKLAEPRCLPRTPRSGAEPIASWVDRKLRWRRSRSQGGTDPPAARSHAVGVGHQANVALLQRATASARRCWIQAKVCIAEWQRRARSRRDLMALDERALWDLRLTRVDAISEAGKPFWKK